MRNIVLTSVLAALSCLTFPTASAAQSLIACGWDEVFVIDAADPSTKRWTWKAADRPELPEAFRTKYRTTDECKPVAGNRLLITASSDGAALVDRASGRALWWGACGNTHSADLLPGSRVVLACSVREGTGNQLVVFDAGVPERQLFATELYSGHGAVWDEARGRLWALGMRELRAYTLADWDTASPRLVLAATYPLPDEGGHDLVVEPDSSRLVVTTHASVWTFDRDTGTFAPHPQLSGLSDVKSVAIHPTTRRLAYIRADAPEWWSSTIRLVHPAGVITLPGERLYKVRWDEDADTQSNAEGRAGMR